MIACQLTSKASKIKVEEGCRKAVFLNPKRKAYVVTEFDGCVVQNATAADWIISRCGEADLIVELKGRSVEHAAAQIRATAEYLCQNRLKQGRLAGLIVCKQYPKESTITQRAQYAFARAFGGALHAFTGNREHDFDELIGAQVRKPKKN